VYIYGIDVVNPANISFSMNNPQISAFHYYNGTGFVYHSLFFSATGLDPQAQHTVAWDLDESSAGGTSASFDYAVITVEQTDASSSTPASSTGGTSTEASQSCVHSTLLFRRSQFR
jgi:hypothetical protein